SYGPQVLWPDHCVQGTPGAAFHPALQIPHAGLVLRKGMERTIDSYSAFYENDHKTPTGSSATCASAASPGCFLPASPSISACAIPLKTRGAKALRFSSSRMPAAPSTLTVR